METMVMNQMMNKIEELQEKLIYLTWVEGVEQFKITSTGTKLNKDITVCGLDLEYEQDGEVTYIMFTDIEDKLVDDIHPLMMFMLNQVSDITITDNNIVLVMGAATYKITPVRE